MGLKESTWLQTTPPLEMVAWVAQDVGAQVKPLTQEEWVGLLEEAGLQDLESGRSRDALPPEMA